MSSEPIIRIEDLRFDYGDGEEGFHLEVASLDIAAGERVACIGPSGSGKTTLVNLMTGILLPRRGRVSLDGETISELGDAARRQRRIRKVGLVFQQFELLEYLSARENVLLPYYVSPHLVLDDGVRARAEELARELGIEHVLKRKPARLSQGERQRVAIARALVTEPRVLFADEPTGNLDPRTAARILDRLFEQASRRGATLLVVTHDHAILERFDRVVDMADLLVGGVS